MLFELSTFWLIVVLIVVIGGASVLGIAIGRRLRAQPAERSKEATGALQATLLGFVGLLLAFGLSLAIGRYETRRDAVADEAAGIDRAHLLAETIPDPMSRRSGDLLLRYTDARIALSDSVPDSDEYDRAARTSNEIQDRLWANARRALEADPDGSATRLYVESLNDMIDTDIRREASLANRIPNLVMWLQIIGAGVALGALGLHLELTDRSMTAVLVSAVFVILIVFVTFDLDRPVRGFISVPDTPLVSVRDEMTHDRGG